MAKLTEIIIDKNSSPEFIMNNFPIRWTISRANGLYYIIDRAKDKGCIFKLTLVNGDDYELKVIKGEENEEKS